MTAEEIKKTKLYKKIRKSLLDQLANSGIMTEYFANLVEDYMNMYVVKELAIDDIEQNGITTRYQNGANQYGTKKNDAVELALKTNQQMIKMLDMLGIKSEPQAEPEEEEL